MTMDPFGAQRGFAPPPFQQPSGSALAGRASLAKGAAYGVMGASVLLTAAGPALYMAGPTDIGGPLLYLAAAALYFGAVAFLYVAGNLWMMSAKAILASQGYPVPATWKIWGAWFIPFYNLVGPFQVMRDLTFKPGIAVMKNKVNMWWGGWLGAGIVSYVSTLSEDPAVLIPVDVISTGLAIMSMWALTSLVTVISEVAEIPVTPPPPYTPPTPL